MQPIRKIIHIDMDAFCASIEQHDRPELKGKSVILAGDPQGAKLKGNGFHCGIDNGLD
jgi:DNA polymerase-4